MRVAICRLEEDTGRARAEAGLGLGAWWARFGDDLLVYSANAAWDGVRERAGGEGVNLREHPDSVAKSDLHLVVQKGRLFQQEHPDVPVLLDKGRYLAVVLDRETARRLGEREEPCYAVRPLAPNEVVFDSRPPEAAARRAPVAWIQALVDKVSRPPLEADLQHLVSFPTRHSTSSEYGSAATWARARLMDMGYSTSLQTIAVGSATSQNVVAEKTGGGSSPRRLVLVVAHLDSVNLAGAASPAPGADDNGSGSAGVLAMARALKDHPGTHDLRFVLFGGEEQGLLGSQQYLDSLSVDEQSRIEAVLNMDMIGTLNTATPTVLLEGAALSQTVIDALAAAAADYTALTVQTSLNPFASDHVPFLDAGVAAVLTIEGADSANGNIHSANDVLAHIDYSLALEILKMNVAFVAGAIGKTAGLVLPDHTLPVGDSLVDDFVPPNWWLSLKVQYSGRYDYNGGIQARPAFGWHDHASTVHDLAEPIFLEESFHPPTGWLEELAKLRFTVHLDCDGAQPLQVVSGTVHQGLVGAGVTLPAHFIGQVTSNTAAAGGGRHLVVENFAFPWPTGETVHRLEITVSGNLFVTPIAEITFLTTAGETRGPFTVPQASPYFREVEVEVDREDHAVDVEPYDTHTHPDRPAGLKKESLTLEKVYGRAGVRITRSSGTNTINTSAAGANNRWSYQELHDAMAANWSAFANRPQWKMWLFLAELADSDTLGGVMFDGNIDEPGGVDRQGTAIFTKSPFYHTAAGDYAAANPPADKAALRELFFNLIHESGHAFNLYHSFSKTADSAWTPPAWMPLISNPQALSWMNYPERPSPGYSAKWFYDRFEFRFDDGDNLFLRHAPARFVMMGGEAWGQSHGRVTRSSLDPRLALTVRTLKKVFELGEPVTVELKLENVGSEPVLVHTNLQPSDGYVRVAITDPLGARVPFIPFVQTRCRTSQSVLAPGRAVYEPLRLNIGTLGCSFKTPGAYRIEASYTNLDGSTAAAVMQLYVRPPASFDDTPVVNLLFDAEVGRVLYVGGTRTMLEAAAKLEKVAERLGAKHPAVCHLEAARALAFARDFKVIDPRTKQIELEEADPELVERRLKPVVSDVERAADTVGHIRYEELVGTYTDAAVQVKKKPAARGVQRKMLSLFKKRKVIDAAIRRAERKLHRLS